MESRPYFAYGSNLCTRQMQQRCPGARVLGRATLRDHAMVFPRYSTLRGGGVAGVVPTPGAVVEGVLYALSGDALLAMDGFEGTHDGHYSRSVQVVHDTAGNALEAWVYLATPMPAAPHAPTRHYRDTILRGAEEHQLPADYCGMLRAITTRD
jgi:gamma-glutamylcyclotransferase (GGCT)/AIG2-like uncharacterized protein YtfP